MIYRRQRQQYIFAGLLVVIAVVNLLFFFILNRPAQTEWATMQTSIQQLQTEIATTKISLASTEKTSKQLDRFDKDKDTLLMMHLIPRHTGYSEIVSTLDDMVKSSGVNKTRVAFNLDPKPRAGLNSVSITIPLEGGYSNVVEFIRELEQSDTLFLITNIDLSSTEPTVPSGPQRAPVAPATGTVALSLGLETFFYQ
jgi:Tfp pilus assembly protein PilO